MGEYVVLEYESGEIRAGLAHSHTVLVNNVSFSLKAGESLALIGETGSGKTMTALSVMGLLPDNVSMYGGSIKFCGELISGKKKLRRLLGDKIVYIPQNGSEFLNPSRTIGKHLYDNLKRIGIGGRELKKQAEEKLILSGLPDPENILDKYPFQLSGGMAQRVTIAISACSNASLIIADEPTNGLDEESKKAFMELLATVFPQAARLIITHDIALASLCDRTAVLCGGRMMEKGDSKAVLEGMKSGYTRALIASLVKNGLKGAPALREEKGFCPFYERCPSAENICKTQMKHCKGDYSEWWCNSP